MVFRNLWGSFFNCFRSLSQFPRSAYEPTWMVWSWGKSAIEVFSLTYPQMRLFDTSRMTRTQSKRATVEVKLKCYYINPLIWRRRHCRNSSRQCLEYGDCSIQRSSNRRRNDCELGTVPDSTRTISPSTVIGILIVFWKSEALRSDLNLLQLVQSIQKE